MDIRLLEVFRSIKNIISDVDIVLLLLLIGYSIVVVISLNEILQYYLSFTTIVEDAAVSSGTDMQSLSNEKTRDTFKESSAVIPSNTEASNEKKYNLTKDASTNIMSEEATTEKRPKDLAVTIASNAITESSSSDGKESHLSKNPSIANNVTKATKVDREASAASVSNTNTQSISNQTETPAEVSLDTETDTPATEKEADFQKSSVTGKID
ncbi:12571_t:CDS:2, partial [Ambispora gerdemannii]